MRRRLGRWFGLVVFFVACEDGARVPLEAPPSTVDGAPRGADAGPDGAPPAPPDGAPRPDAAPVDVGPIPPDIAAPTPDATAALPPPPPSVEGLLYASTVGTSLHEWVPIGEDGPGEPRRLAPTRGRDYGGRVGSTYLVGVTPDDRRLVLSFFSVSARKWALFVVPSDGSAADEPRSLGDGRASLSSPEGTFAPDGSTVIYTDYRGLVRLNLDGAGSPELLVGPSPALGRPERPVRVESTGRLVFLVTDDEARTALLSVPLADAGAAPTVLVPHGDAVVSWPVPLPDGRVVAATRVGWVSVPSEGGPATLLVPAERGATEVHLSPDARSLAYVGRSAEDEPTLALYETSSDEDRPRLIVGGLGFATLAGYAGGALVACADGDLIRFDPRPDGGRSPVRLAAIGTNCELLTALGSGSIGLAGAGRFVFHAGADPTAGMWLQPVDGRPARQLSIPSTAACIGRETGLLCSRPGSRTSWWRLGSEGAELRGPEQPGAARALFLPRVSADGSHLLCGMGGFLDGALYAISLRGQPGAVRLVSGYARDLGDVAGHALVLDRPSGLLGRVRAVPFDQGEDAARTLAEGDLLAAEGAPQAGGVLVRDFLSDSVRFVALDAPPREVLATADPGSLFHFDYDPRTGRVVALVSSGEARVRLAAAALDGSEARAPLLSDEFELELDLGTRLIVPPGGGRILVASEARGALLTVPTVGPAALRPVQLAPRGYTLWRSAYTAATSTFTPDGLYAFVVGPAGLHVARLDGGEPPRHLLDAPWPGTDVPPGAISPDSRHLATQDAAGAGWLLRVDGSEPARLVTPAGPEPDPQRFLFSADGTRLVASSGCVLRWLDVDRPEVHEIGGDCVGTPVALTPDGTMAITSKLDVLYAVPLDQAGDPVPLTPADDSDPDAFGFVP